MPPVATAELGTRAFGLYFHVPFCASRCGYCDFNTYTELGHLTSSWADTAIAELRLAAATLGPVEVSTVFFGGGTPTLLPPADLARVLRAADDCFGLAPGAEVSTEANPDSVDARALAELRAAGFTRISFGMQSAATHVLAVLDRTHTPGRAEQAAREAAAAGFADVSLDLIYGTPGESDADWQASLDAALAAGVGHVSAYALIVEAGTRLARQVANGELPPPDDDALADRYLMAEAALGHLGWYEVSNWGRPCQHNLTYWRGDNWWGIGPGAHSHVGGVRWWNSKHPTTWTARLTAGLSPAAAREVLSPEDRRVERVLLELRLREGLPLDVLTLEGNAAAERAVAAGLLEPLTDGRAVLTLRGRLLADAVVRDLVA
ncbi:MAG TPA: radical SAM family heme chaperone HemW [Mycobacteriales bacterium]|nr:radical SAM family heme chaperone HemW [Mycobacteriales bacterium]